LIIEISQYVTHIAQSVIPAKAGIQCGLSTPGMKTKAQFMDSRLRGNDWFYSAGQPKFSLQKPRGDVIIDTSESIHLMD